MLERKPGSIGHPIKVVMYRIDAGAVPVSNFAKGIESPHIVFADGETRGSESPDLRAADVLEKILGFRDVGLEGRRTLRVNSDVRVSVACNFVTGFLNAPNQAGESFCDPSENEEGSVDVMEIEKGQDSISILFDARLNIVPLGS